MSASQVFPTRPLLFAVVEMAETATCRHCNSVVSFDPVVFLVFYFGVNKVLAAI